MRKHNAKLVVIDLLYGANSAESLSDGRSARGLVEVGDRVVNRKQYRLTQAGLFKMESASAPL